MPWALWVVVALFAAMWLPIVGERTAYLFMIFTFLAIDALPALVLALPSLIADVIWSRPPVASITGVIGRADGPPVAGWRWVWGMTGWTGMTWLVATLLLCAWIALRWRAGEAARGPVNALVLLVGWPILFFASFSSRWRRRIDDAERGVPGSQRPIRPGLIDIRATNPHSGPVRAAAE